MRDFTAEQRAFIRHRIASALDGSSEAKVDRTCKHCHRKIRDPKLTKCPSCDTPAQVAIRKGTLMSDKAFSEFIGRHYNTVREWATRPDIQAAIAKGVEDALSSKDYFGLILKQQYRESLWTEYEKATGADRRHYLRMIGEETKGVEDSDEALVPAEDLTVEDLCAVLLDTEVSAAGLTAAQLRARIKGEERLGTAVSP